MWYNTSFSFKGFVYFFFEGFIQQYLRSDKEAQIYDISVLKSFLKRENYEKYRNYVDEKDLPREVAPVLKGLDLWYKENTEDATVEDVANLTFAHGVAENQRDYLTQVFHTMHSVNGEESVNKLLERFRKSKIANQIALSSLDAMEGRKGFDDIVVLAEKLKETVVQEEITYVTDDLEDILNSTKRTPGLRWRLDSLNKRLGSLRNGDFGTVFARPESGKTTFLASEVTFMAGQLKEEDGPILWFKHLNPYVGRRIEKC